MFSSIAAISSRQVTEQKELLGMTNSVQPGLKHIGNSGNGAGGSTWVGSPFPLQLQGVIIATPGCPGRLERTGT
jgi:hypothetical protein